MRIRTNRMVAAVAAFLLPALLLGVVLAMLGVYPFGNKTVLIADMSSEYVDYYAQLHHQVREGGSLLRSWDMGMGLNMLGLIAFYAASPFLILVLIFPLQYITEVILLITLLKIGLCGLFFYIYAREVAPDISRWLCVLAGAAYGLMGYNLYYASNLMWLDGVAFLPLVLLGVEWILKSRRTVLTGAALAYVFLTSYYIGYMVGIFSFLYLTARYFSGNRGLRGYIRAAGRLLLAAAAAAGCCAFLLLPAFLGLKNGQDGMWDLPMRWRMWVGITDLAAKLLPGVYDSITDAGLPNIYCTVPAALLAVLYFFCGGIPRREKCIFGGLVVLILVSFSCEILDMAWHAFEDPTWYPARYSFVFSCLLLYLALRALSNLSSLRRGGILGGCGILLLVFAEVGLRRHSFVHSRQVIGGILLVAAYTALLLIGKGGYPARAKMALLAALLLVPLEAGYNAWEVTKGLDEHFVFKSRTSFYGYRDGMLPAVREMRRDYGGVYRAEVLPQRSANGGMAMNYNGISHYSTTTDQALNSFLRRLGYNTGTINELRFSRNTPLTNGLLGIRYVLSPDSPGPGYALIGQAGEIGIYENACAFPLAFFADAAALEANADHPDPFALQNQLIQSLDPENNADLFHPLTVAEEPPENMDRAEREGYVEYTRRVQKEDAGLTFLLDNPGQKAAYAFLPVYNRRYAVAEAYANGIQVAEKEFAYRSNTVLPLGADSAIRLRFAVDSGRVRLEETQYFYGLDLDAAAAVAGKAQQNAMNFTLFTDTKIAGVIQAAKDGALVTTFPYDTGWTIKIDGQTVPARRFAGVFLAAPLSQGEHRVEMRYWPPGFRSGLAISVLTALLFFLRKKKSKQKKNEPPAALSGGR